MKFIQSIRLFFIIICIPLLLNGCAGAMRNYDREMSGTLNHIETGNVNESLKHIDSNNQFGDKDLLYYLEKSELLGLHGKPGESLKMRLLADEKIKKWEQEARFNPQALLGTAGSVIVNDKVRRYDGRDYEKVFLSNRLAINHLQLGDWDKARIEIKKMHEREAIIAEFRAKEIEDAERKASQNGIHTTYNDLAGYPVATLNDPAVTALKNGYQNALSHYLAGFVYESLGEKSLAAAGYRQAVELRPDNNFLKKALLNLDKPKIDLSKKAQGPRNDLVDTLIIFESGRAPSLKSVQIPIPVPLGRQIGVTPVSFPTIDTHPDSTRFAKITLGNTDVELNEVVDFNLMAKRALKDEMPGIVTRSVIRAVSKAVAQNAANREDKSGVSGLLLLIGGLIIEGADERTWRTLPSTISVGRASFKEGSYKLAADSPSGRTEREVKISGHSKIILIRQLGSTFSIQTSKTPDEAKNDTIALETESSNTPNANDIPEAEDKPNLLKAWLDKLNFKKTE